MSKLLMYFMRALFDFLTEFSIFDAPDPVNRFEVRGNFSVIRRKKRGLYDSSIAIFLRFL
mgnify:CR=1